jgi:hypothetical protein
LRGAVLGINRNTLRKRLGELGIAPEDALGALGSPDRGRAGLQKDLQFATAAL